MVFGFEGRGNVLQKEEQEKTKKPNKPKNLLSFS